MIKKDCKFCKVITGELPSVKIWEDEKHMAFLGNHPNMEGMTLVVPKSHYDSDAADMPDKEYTELMLAAKKVSKLLEKGLKIKRCSLIMEGMGVNHVHIKLYPLHGIDSKFKEMWGDKEVFFEKYEGYVTTLEGPKKTIDELKIIGEKILKNK